MPTSSDEHSAVRERVVSVLERILGYEFDNDADQLTELDSLQVLELLVSLEEEFDIDSDQIIESRPDWWVSIDHLVDLVSKMTDEAHPEVAKQG